PGRPRRPRLRRRARGPHRQREDRLLPAARGPRAARPALGTPDPRTRSGADPKWIGPAFVVCPFSGGRRLSALAAARVAAVVVTAVPPEVEVPVPAAAGIPDIPEIALVAEVPLIPVPAGVALNPGVPGVPAFEAFAPELPRVAAALVEVAGAVPRALVAR